MTPAWSQFSGKEGEEDGGEGRREGGSVHFEAECKYLLLVCLSSFKLSI